jgi:hypothetical protein
LDTDLDTVGPLKFRKTIDNKGSTTGGEGRNRTHTAYTSHSLSTVFIITDALKIKGSIRYVKVNLNWLLITPFYSLPLWFAGISAGTFSRCFKTQTYNLRSLIGNVREAKGEAGLSWSEASRAEPIKEAA